MRSRVVLEEKSSTQDALGQPSTAWLPVAPIWADIQHTSGLEAIKSGADTSTVKASVRIRHREVHAGQRLVHGALRYQIKAVLRGPTRDYLNLVCEQDNADS
jgi:SPP1 family predicted phage head-tail adaptor